MKKIFLFLVFSAISTSSFADDLSKVVALQQAKISALETQISSLRKQNEDILRKVNARFNNLKVVNSSSGSTSHEQGTVASTDANNFSHSIVDCAKYSDGSFVQSVRLWRNPALGQEFPKFDRVTCIKFEIDRGADITAQ